MSDLLPPDCAGPDRFLVDLAYEETTNVPPEVRAHVAGCARCTRVLRELREVRSAFGGQPMEEPSSNLDANVLKALDASLAGEDVSGHMRLPDPELALGAKRLAARISSVPTARASPVTPAPARLAVPRADSAGAAREERARPVRARRNWPVIAGSIVAVAAVVTFYVAGESQRSLLLNGPQKSAESSPAPVVAQLPKKVAQSSEAAQKEERKLDESAADRKYAASKDVAAFREQQPTTSPESEVPPPPATLPSPPHHARAVAQEKSEPAYDKSAGEGLRDHQLSGKAAGPAPFFQHAVNDLSGPHEAIRAAEPMPSAPAPTVSAAPVSPPPPSPPAASVVAPPPADQPANSQSNMAPSVVEIQNNANNTRDTTSLSKKKSAKPARESADAFDSDEESVPDWSAQLEIARAAVQRGDQLTASAAFARVLGAAGVPQDALLEAMTGRWRSLLALGRLDEAQAAAKVLERHFPGRTTAMTETMAARAKARGLTAEKAKVAAPPATSAPAEAKPAAPASISPPPAQ